MTGIGPLREEDSRTGRSAGATASIDCGVHRPETTRPLVPSRAKTIVFLGFVFFLFTFVGVRLSASLQGTDFPDFYCAARMLLEGHGHQLYDTELQRQYQERYAGGVGTLNIHPPFEAPLYSLVAWLPLRQAYLLWFALNLLFLGIAVRHLAGDLSSRWHWSVLLAASFTFVPVLLSLLQGQDSLLLLLAMILAFTALRHERPFAAGCWFGLALCKFQIVLPLVLVLIFTRSKTARSELAKGFGLLALVFAALSAAISGWAVFVDYPRFLLSLQTQSSSGVAPTMMANFHGLVHIVFRGEHSGWAIAAVSILSAAALIKAVSVWKRALPAYQPNSSDSMQRAGNFDLAFTNTLLAALLVSYYLNPHDLSLLLLPILLALHHAVVPTFWLQDRKNWLMLGLIAILFLPPLHLWALSAHLYALVALPLFFLFLISGTRLRQSRSIPMT